MMSMQAIQPETSISNTMAAKEQPHSRRVRECRVTKGGRTLWYELDVLQQPERARACGSGPKSSADRRPVDPPPVVTLKVYEGETLENARDITFDYNVDFFCYASLEHARPMAHGRVQTPAATSPPVLTGFPVSGCCYLDRPAPAGYFLFPDLSVRHEGRYRLVFSLYELIKEDQDQDRDAPQQTTDDVAMTGTKAGDAAHRMDLKSHDFVVYSAKKFPGLTESTTLSRTVAEQGCRVRIRRDVRMRRREPKASGTTEYENKPEEEYTRRQRTRTPDVYRARSVSNSSVDRTSFTSEPQRRPSNADYGGPPPPPLYQSGQSTAVLNFGHGAATTSFVQPYGPVPTSNPHSTPVSPAQPRFPQGNSLPPPVSPGYAPPNYPHYERPEAESQRRSSGSYPPLTGKPPMTYSRPSTGSGSLIPPMPSLASMISPKLPLAQTSDRLGLLSGPMRPYYAHIEPNNRSSLKRSADDHTYDERLVGGNRPSIESTYPEPEPDCEQYRRADGSVVRVNFGFT